jgi:hypothetical protein
MNIIGTTAGIAGTVGRTYMYLNYADDYNIIY